MNLAVSSRLSYLARLIIPKPLAMTPEERIERIRFYKEIYSKLNTEEMELEAISVYHRKTNKFLREERKKEEYPLMNFFSESIHSTLSVSLSL